MGDDLQGLRTSLDSLADVIDNRKVLNYLLRKGKYVQLQMKPVAGMSYEQAQRLYRYNTQGPDPSSIWNMVKQSLPV